MIALTIAYAASMALLGFIAGYLYGLKSVKPVVVCRGEDRCAVCGQAESRHDESQPHCFTTEEW
jgi:hypothetical protein